MTRDLHVPATELEAVPLFAELTPEELDRVRDRSTERIVAAGKEIIGQGDRSDELFVVLEGTLKVSRHTRDGHEVIIGVLGVGDVAGVVVLGGGTEHPSSVAALEDARVLAMHGDDFRALIRDVPSLQWGVIESLARRLRLAESRQEALASLDVEGRVANVLLVLAEDHGEPKPGGGTRIRIPFTQGDVAAMTGASRVRVNQVLSKFRRKGWITMDGTRRTSVQNIDELRRTSGSSQSGHSSPKP